MYRALVSAMKSFLIDLLACRLRCWLLLFLGGNKPEAVVLRMSYRHIRSRRFRHGKLSVWYSDSNHCICLLLTERSLDQ